MSASAIDESVGDAKWFGFDTENDDEGRVTLTSLVSENGDVDEVWHRDGYFMKWMLDKARAKERTVVICHNVEYDCINEMGVDKFAEMQLNYLKGRLISARCGSVLFHDSGNHFRMPLLDIGKCIGIDKKEMDIHDPEYVRTDARICLKVMTQARDYIASLGGKIGATAGSSALSVWAFMTDKEFFTGAVDNDWMRKGYYGGRVEIFRKHARGKRIGWECGCNAEFNDDGGIERESGPELHTDNPEMCPNRIAVYEKSVRGYDINSMYPHCMMNDFPEYVLEDPRFSKAKGLAEVTITIPTSIQVAPLCWRSPKGQLLYPVGRIRGVWSYDEIRMAESMGCSVAKVHRALGSNSLVRPFDDFITTLYAKRKTSTNEAERLFLKVMMNSLYGKMATRNTVTRTVWRDTLETTERGRKRLDDVKWITYHRGLLDYHSPSPDYVNVVWGAMITAYARVLLLQYMLQVPPEKLIYCDTDSVYTFEHELDTSPELGEMKLEKTVSEMKVVQPKAYKLDDFYRAKGVPRPREDKNGIVVDYAERYIERGFVDFQAPIRFRRSLNSRQGRANQWVRHTKSLKSNYTQKSLSNGRYYPPVVGEQMEFGQLTQQAESSAGRPRRGALTMRVNKKHYAEQYALPLSA